MVTNIPKVSPEQLKVILEKALDNPKTPIMLWGALGINASAIPAQVAQEKGIDFVLLQCPLLDAFGLDDWAKGKDKGILFLDELTSASSLIQAKLYQLILNRVTLPDGWLVIVAAHAETRGCMPTALTKESIELVVE